VVFITVPRVKSRILRPFNLANLALMIGSILPLRSWVGFLREDAEVFFIDVTWLRTSAILSPSLLKDINILSLCHPQESDPWHSKDRRLLRP